MTRPRLLTGDMYTCACPRNFYGPRCRRKYVAKRIKSASQEKEAEESVDRRRMPKAEERPVNLEVLDDDSAENFASKAGDDEDHRKSDGGTNRVNLNYESGSKTKIIFRKPLKQFKHPEKQKTNK